jgi:hypothetical protein
MDNTSKSYLIYSFNGWFIILFFLIGSILPLFLIGAFIETKNPIIIFLIIALFMVASYFLTRKLGLRPIRVNFDTEKIVFQFLTKDLKKAKKRKTISMKYIKGFSDFTFGNHDVFKLKLQYGATFSIYKNGFWYKNDDFERLTFNFKEFIDTYNTSGKIGDEINTQRKKIEYKDFFQTQNATILFYVTIAFSILLIYMIVSGESKSLSGAFVAIGGMLGYIGTYLTKRNKFRIK